MDPPQCPFQSDGGGGMSPAQPNIPEVQALLLKPQSHDRLPADHYALKAVRSYECAEYTTPGTAALGRHGHVS